MSTVSTEPQPSVPPLSTTSSPGAAGVLSGVSGEGNTGALASAPGERSSLGTENDAPLPAVTSTSTAVGLGGGSIAQGLLDPNAIAGDVALAGADVVLGVPIVD